MFFKSQRKTSETLLSSFGDSKKESFDFPWIEKYFRRKDNSTAFHILSDKTCNDLDFQELFMFLDRTTSKVGQQVLYNKLRAAPIDKKKNEIVEKLINEFTSNQNFRFSVQLQISKLNGQEAFHIADLFQSDHIKPPRWLPLAKFLTLACLVSVILALSKPIFFFFLGGFFFINLLLHYENKRNMYSYSGSIPQLLRLNKIADELNKIESLKSIDPDLHTSIMTLSEIKNQTISFDLDEKMKGDMQAVA